MKCPNCNEDIPGITCPQCSNTIPEESIFCMYCGVRLQEASETDDDNVDFGKTDEGDFEDRVPCSDGNCIGIIVDGKCNVCGKPYKESK
jgi:hypothetical protein